MIIILEEKMQIKKQEELQEFFDLQDIKSGMAQVRDATKVTLSSLVQILDSMLLPFRVFFSLSKSSAVAKIVKYKDRTQERNREIEAALRPYDFNADMILLNPVLALATLPSDTVNFLFDEAGADEVPRWLKKAQDELSDKQTQTTQAIRGEPGLLSKLASIFFITESVEDSIETLISEAAELSRGEKEALEIFKSLGVDIKGAQNEYFSDMAGALEPLLITLQRRLEIFEKLSGAKTASDLLNIVNLSKRISPELNTTEVEKKIKEFEAGSDDDPQAINQAISSIMKEGAEELKKEVIQIISEFPSIEKLEKASHPSSSKAREMLIQIKALAEKL